MQEGDVCLDATLRSGDRCEPVRDGNRDPDDVQHAISGDGRGALRPIEPQAERIIRPSRGADPASGALSGRGQHSSGAGSSDGGTFGQAGRAGLAERLRFDASVPLNGYRWWYLDALSDDGSQGLVIIGFVGSVFSPYYASARRRGETDPEAYCAINVALYGRNRNYWAMTERGRRWLQRSRDTFRVGPSSMSITGDALTIEIDEVSMPIPARIRGRVRLAPSATTEAPFQLDAAGRHLWHPIAPIAHVEADFDKPGMRFSGHGYLDTNWGSEPLEASFRSWNWSRGRFDDKAIIFYDSIRRDGSTAGLALSIGSDGQVASTEAPPISDLPGTLWRVPRAARSDFGTPARLVRTLEDTPFYTRSVIDASIGGQRVTSVHESLSLDRFSSSIVQWMLPFRMPRRG